MQYLLQRRAGILLDDLTQKVVDLFRPVIRIFSAIRLIANLANEKDTAVFVSNTISKYKTVEAALMLAGGFDAGDIAKTPSADLLKMLTLNFETAYHVARPLFEHMKQHNISK